MLKNMENKIYHILVLNLGTTSFKYKLFEVTNKSEKEIANGAYENVGSLGTMSHMDAFAETEKTLKQKNVLKSFKELDAVGYKAVHAGDLTGLRIIDKNILKIMEQYSAFAPAHNPIYISVARCKMKLK